MDEAVLPLYGFILDLQRETAPAWIAGADLYNIC